MNPNDPNVAMMELVADRLGEGLREQLVFVGGAVAGLLITDPALPAIRPTEDVDLVVQAAARADYHRVEQALRKRGFANRWYPQALTTAVKTALPSGLLIRLVSAPMFVATKLEAFADRGQNDYLFSHDLGDLMAVIDGRAELIEECRQLDEESKDYLRNWMQRLLATPAFIEALPGHLPGDIANQARVPELTERLHLFANLD